MAAAVADYRPAEPADSLHKLERSGDRLTLHLAPTPDLLADLAAAKRPGQTFVGFALEEPARLMERAEGKRRRKELDLIVANPLATMDADEIEAILLGPEGVVDTTEGKISKKIFARWLLERIIAIHSGPAGDESPA